MDIHTKKSLIYEPRALWSRAAFSLNPDPSAFFAVDPLLSSNPLQSMNRNDFRNGSRFPFELTHLTLAPLGYAVQTTGRTDPVLTGGSPSLFTYRFDQGNIAEMEISIRTPKRSQISPGFVQVRSLAAEAVFGAQEQFPITASTTNFPSSLFGLYRWDFDRPYALPRNAIIQFSMGPTVLPDIGISTGLVNWAPRASYCFHSHGINDGRGRFGSEGRTFSPFFLRAAQQTTSFAVFPAGLLPVNVQSTFFDGAAPPLSVDTPWPGQHEFDPTAWLEQEASRGGVGSYIDGFSVCIDQAEYDREAYTGRLAANLPNSKVAQLPIATRCRTKDAGTNEWWWKPGAPLALVSPSCNDGLTFKLQKPIMLGPGESIEVLCRFPTDTTLATTDQGTVYPLYQLGVSFTGYAVVEG